MSTRVSVIICTHNPRRDYLERTLQALRSQTFPPSMWELLLVDNASSRPLAHDWDLSWHPAGRHVREERIGLTAARLRGMDEAHGEALLFLDDDNVAAEDYIERAVSLLEGHPSLGVIGAGSLEPEFEVPPPSELADRLSLLALRTVPAPRWSNNPEDGMSLPWGAGICMTGAVVRAYRRLLARLDVASVVGRRGDRLFSGEDDLFSWAAAAAGLGFGVFPELRILHLISAQRLSKAYFVRLIGDKAFSNGVIRILLAGEPPASSNLRRAIRLLLHGAGSGLFSFRCRVAEARGEREAKRLVRERELRTLSWTEVIEAVN